MKRHLVGFAHRVVYATLIAIVVWILYVFPFDARSAPFRFLAVKTLAWPVALVSRAMPEPLKAIDPWASYPFAHNERPEVMLLLHLRLAIPVYVALFYVPSLIARLRRR